jgi:hypothetical protein
MPDTNEQFLLPQAQPRHETEQASQNRDMERFIDRAKTEARRESSRRSAKNNRLRQKNLIATLQAENQFLRTELTKALNRIDQLKLTLHQETERALEYNRCLQFMLENNMMNQQQSREDLRRISCTNGTVSSEPTLSRLLEMLHSIDSQTFEPASTSSMRSQQDEQTGNGFAFRSSSLRPATYSSRDAGNYGHGAGSGSYMFSRYSSIGRTSNSDSMIVTDLEQLDRLREELEILKGRVNR